MTSLSLRIIVWSMLSLFILSSQICIAGTVSGELRKWHKVTVSFDGPNTSETATPNPFTNYRLQVTFTNGVKSYNVPGYYAADGNAANSSSNSGNKWHVHFAPDEVGTWTYTASFRTGNDVAMSTDPNAGSPTSFNGDTGTFTISATNKTGRDHRGKGRLEYVGEHYLQHQETGEFFVKMGSDAPENTFAYEDFDDVPNRGNRRKSWAPHQQDYNAADASAYTWKNGQGTELLGAIKYLANKGMNVFSFLTLSLHGDDENVFPHRLKVPVGTYNGYSDAQQWNNGVHHDRFDVSRLAQWEKVMEYGDKIGMYMHFKTFEYENDMIMDGNSFGRERRIYYRELVARFGHHLALNWNLGEECHLSAAVINSTANYIKAIDPYDHIIVFHTFPNNFANGWPKYDAHLGTNFQVDGASIQGNDNNYDDARGVLTQFIDKSRNANKKWVVAFDEQGTGQYGIQVDPTDRKKVRHKVIWNSLMAGAAGAEFYYGGQTSCNDMNCQNHRTRDQKYTDANFALNFFRDYLPFHQMVENDGRTGDGADYVFEKNNEIYAVYRPNGGSTGINLPTGNWTVQWYNPRNGVMQTATNPIANTLTAPDNNDWVALIYNCDGYEEENGMIVIEMESLPISGTDWAVKTTTPGYTGTGYLEWQGQNWFGTPGNGLIEVPITINTPGTYRFQWRNRVGFGNVSSEHNDSWLKFPDADDFYGEKANGSIVYPKGSGKTPVPNGAGALGWFKTWAAGALNWSWSTITSDGDGHNIYAQFDNPGVYTMQISGRSQYHQIDRLVMYLPGVANPLDLNNPETDCTPGGGGGCTVGTPCNDNDPNTYYDQINGNCACVGIPAQPIPSRIEAESHFEQSGIQNVATADSSGTKIGWIDSGDSTRYLVDVTPGDYIIRVRAGSSTPGGTVNVLLNGTSVALVPVTNTGGYEVFQTFTLNATLTNPGIQIMTLVFTGPGPGGLFDVNWIEFINDCTAGTPCNDSDACTINDVYDNSCNCVGTFEDTDNDSVCDADDVCPNFDDTLIGTPCNDNDPATTNDVYTTNCICQGSLQPAIICLEPIHDAYLQGAGGTLFNTTQMRVETNNRVGYFMFDLSNIVGTVTSAELQLTVGSDAGDGRIMMEAGATNNWTETTLSNANKPAAAGLLGELTQGAYALNTAYTWNLTGVTVGNNYSIIMTQTSGNDISFKSQEVADVPGRPTLCLTVTPPTPQTQTVDCDVQLFMEGPFDGQNKMKTDLNSLNLVPAGQPFTGPPWNYGGTEMNTVLPTNAVDWVLVSLRTSPAKLDEIAKGAIILLEDGTTATNLSAVVDVSINSLYVVVEHRNHLPVMSPTAIPIVNGLITHDFRAANGYVGGAGLGQKQMGTNWMLFAANADQSQPTGYEITGADNILWQVANGNSNIYFVEDFNMDGDVNGADKVLWSYNNGVFSSVPK